MPEPDRHYGPPPQPVAEPTLLTLVRHGQTTGNVRGSLSGITDDPLTPLGRRQAAAMGKRLAALITGGTLPPIAALYVSPLQRARNTAQAIAAPLGITPIPRDDLKELDFGHMEGMTPEEASARFPDDAWGLSYHPEFMEFAYPGGESRRGFHARSVNAIAEIIAAHPGEHVVVVAHGGVLGVAIAHYMTGDSAKWRDYVLANCSISRLTVQGDDVTLHCVNDVAHLADLTPEEAEAIAEIGAAEEAAND